MLESGIDRIISQVVDPKINHIFRPQVEKAVHEFLATLNHKETASSSTAPAEEKPEASVLMQGVSPTTASASAANDAMSILETITSLNQEASAARTCTEATSSKTNDRVSKRVISQQTMDSGIERDQNTEDLPDEEKVSCNSAEESCETIANGEGLNNLFSSSEEGKTGSKEINTMINPSKDALQESDELKSKMTDKCDRKPESSEKGEKRKDKKEKSEKKLDFMKKSVDDVKLREEKASKDRETESIKCSVLEKSSSKRKVNECTKQVFEDSDVDMLSDITVSSVHTSDLSSFEEESEEEVAPSDSTEEGEIFSDDEEEQDQISSKVVAAGANDKKRKAGRHAYVHKPYLYSKYYSDSDDERTVEQRRLSVAREKEERLLRRRRNREKLEKRKQKAVEKTKKLKIGNQGKSVQTLEESSARGHDLKASGASIKDVLKEQRFLEKKVALSRKRKREARYGEEGRKKKCEQPEENLGELKKVNETDETSSFKELKAIQGKNEGRRIQGSVHSTDENKTDSKVEKEYKRKAYTSLQVEGIQQDTDAQDSKSQFVRADDSSEEPPKQKNVFRNENSFKKDDLETQSVRNVPKKEARSSKDRNEKERSLSEDKLIMKHKYKGDIIQKISDDVESSLPDKGLKSDESLLKHSQLSKAFLDDKAEKKNKHRSERKISVNIKDVKNISDHGSKNEENSHKENKKDKLISIDKLRTEHKSKRLSNDSRPQKESQSVSKQHSSVSSRKSEIYIDRPDAGSANVGNTVRQSDVVQKDRRRSKSALEERSLLKSRPKSQSKQTKVSESELQESFSKKESGQKLDKDKNTEETDPDKQYQFKNEMTVFEENCVEFELQHGVHSVSNSQKDFSHRVKSQSGEKSMKEKPRSDKDLSSFKLERKLSMEGHKNRGPKHSSKDVKKREENNKPEDRSIKQLESNTKIQENDLLNDKKPIKRLTSENRKGSLLVQETDTRKEKLSPVTAVARLFPTLQNPGWNSEQSLHPEQNQESREIVLEKRHGNAYHQVTQVEESSNNSQQEAKFASAAKDQMDDNSVYKLNRILLTQELQKSSLLSDINPKQKIEHFSPKDIDTPIDSFKQASKDVGSIEEEQYYVITECEKSDKTVLDGSPKGKVKLEFQSMTEDSQSLKKIKNMMGPGEESNYPIKNYSREYAVDHKSMDIDFKEDTSPLNDISKEVPFNLYTPCLKDTILDNQTHTVKKEQHDSIVLCSSIKEDDITSMEFVNKDGKMHLCSKEATEEKIVPTSTQEAIVKEKNGNASLPNDSFIGRAIEFTGVNVDKSVLIKMEEEKRDDVSDGSVNNGKSAIEFKNKGKESHTISSPKEWSSKLIPPNVPEDMNMFSAMGRELEGRYSGVGSQSENCVVVSSVGGSSCINICNFMESDVDIGTSTEGITGRTVTATSTGLHEEGVSKQQREGDAIITCSEEKSKTALSCTSIEADEGFIVGTWTKNKEGAHFVTEAEESSSVSEGLAVCESSSASTKENGDVECIVHYVEESTKQLINENGIENDQSMNSLVTEEKDDAVTSAGSEERCMASACGGTSNFDSAATSIGEVESDGAVTSASIEAQDGSSIIENPDEFQSNAVGAEPIKGAEGVVTCTGTESVGSVVYSVTVTDSQEISVVNGVYAEMVNSEEIGPHADESEEIISGESAVTSTGITAEDDPEAAAACTGLEDTNEGFVAALNTEEKYEHAIVGTEARAEKNITETSQGSYDDEGCVTSTGAKEDDEEGEDFVTSTGRCSEESELILTCAETEESERGMVGVEATENRHSSVCLVTDQLETKLDELTSNADKNSVDSMMGLEEKKKIGNISNNTKGIVESSTTSIGMSNENIVFVKEKEEDSSLIKKCECDIINAATSYNQSLAQEWKKGRAASCLDGRECEDSLVSKKVAIVPASANEGDNYEVETISTSTIKLCPTVAQCSAADIDEVSSPVAKTVENFSEVTEKAARLLDADNFSVSVPSTAAVGKQDEVSTKLNKNSAGILKEFEAPVPSITEEKGENLCATVRAEEIITNVGKYNIPLPGVASGGTGGNRIVHVKEPRDECTVISTSIIEGTEVPVSQEGTEDTGQLFPLRSEPTDAAIISTSSAEYFKTSVFPENMHEVHLICRTKQKLETFANSTTEECEKTARDVVTPVETRERNEGSMVFTDIIEEGKVVRESTTGRFELAVQSAEESKSAIALVKEGRYCNILEGSVANNKSDQQLVTLSIENPGDNTNARILDKCDSIYTVAASEESLLNVLKETPLAFVSIEVKDDTKSTMCAKQSDCTMLLAQVSHESCSTVLHKEGHRFHQGDPEGILEESSTSQTTDIGSIEVLANTLKSINTRADVYTKTCFNSSFGDDSSTEFVMQEKRRQGSGQRDKAPSSPSGILLKKEEDSEYLSADYINHKPALKTERRDSSNRKCLTSFCFELGRNSEDRALAGETDLCRQYDHNKPEAFSQRTTGCSNDNQEIPNVVEKLEESMQMTDDKELQCRNPEKNHLDEENQTQRIHKDCENSDSWVKAEEDQALKENVLQLQVAILDKEEESLMSRTNRHISVEEDNIPLCQILGKEEEQHKYFEAKSTNNMQGVVRGSEEILKGTAELQDHSSRTVEGKDETVDKVEILEEPDTESILNPAEVNQQVTVKRKRGRPRKYPVEVKPLQGQDSKRDTSTGNMLKTSGPRSKQKITSKGSLNENERHSETNERKAEVVLRRRGRKRKRPLIPLEEAGMDTSEPDRKWQKLTPAVEKETKDQDESKQHDDDDDGREAADNSGDADEIHSGATTRSASRLEAQRKQPHKPTTRAASKNQSPDAIPPTMHQKLAEKKRSPSTAKSNRSVLAHSKLQSAKRKSISPLVLHKKGHQRTDETELKKSRR